jgi:predicted RNA binding protein YcfA (HicA-like mRNA interferase family)
MPALGPIKRRDLVRYLRQLGFKGPYAGTKHQFMIKGNLTLTLPNLHQSDIGVGLLSRILKQAHISREEWERL